ncbi:DoxX family protein [candidate division BRC1 bacterium HGW-BRC1-1]|jgi:uncharacterized membrane protein YphA (DoxX/SURF4 family)|nr:MAG: DoxX family protein [candidate division BRC1 bacterium HGW-BRC1-1]
MNTLRKLVRTDDSTLTIILRVMVGVVFLVEGIQKFLYPAELGVGRFIKIGIPAPEILAPFTAGFEIGAGLCVLLGLFTRPAALALVTIMIVAITSTKIPILLGHGFWGFSLRSLPRYGFLAMAHEMRTDWAMLLGSIYLLIAGGGRWSIDRKVAGRDGSASGREPR